MAKRYLLDTNILSHLIRQPQGRIAEHIRHVGEERVCTSIVVAAELRFGAAKRGHEGLRENVERVLDAIDVLPFEPPADAHYAAIRLALERLGTPIGPNDLLVAAHARAADCVLVTANDNEFRRVPALEIVNWLVEPPEAAG
ncbi:MAG: type II toxin-antitoxin system VapC family toxin [Casimicrobiaceae bacterium]|nr:type II toxin-antitoxin system VapC family toxin [Casimicrobiaceae bacterium]